MFRLFCAFVLLFTMSLPYNQINAEENKSPTRDLAQEAYGREEEQNKEETLYNRATDSQIKEAQNYYDACKESETVSARKDCKCAATAYLEKRIELGDETSIEDVMSENLNVCLKDTNARLTSKEITLENVTEGQKAEAQAVFQRCKSRSELRQRIDCECLGAKFLEQRIILGPITKQQDIISSIEFQCKNVVEQVGLQYNYCLQITKAKKTGGMELKPFCECVAKKWGELYEAAEGIISYRVKARLTTQAKEHCRYNGSGQ